MELLNLLKQKEVEKVFQLLVPDIDYWIDMLYRPVKKNISYRMALHFNNAEFEDFKNNVEEADAWQEIAIIYYKQIKNFQIFEYYSPSAPALHLKRQITTHVANYIAARSRLKVLPYFEIQYPTLDEEEISNRLELEKIDPYIRYVYSIALAEFSFENLMSLTKTEATYRFLRSVLDENKIRSIQ